jgi:ubiquinone/menaquinone biosynthesis C-methylase UbiE
MTDASHRGLILDQFTRQAQLFSTAAPITSDSALRMIVEAARPGPDDTMLDVACGGGLVVCAFAPRVKQATGFDVTPAMLEQAKKLAAEKGLTNVAWRQGDATALPYADASFTVVTTRFSFHHFPDPLAVLREMVRVCAPGGRVLVIDSYASEDQAKAVEFNRLELLRDPSHVRNLALSELQRLFDAAGLPAPQTAFYELRDSVANLLARSFPNPGDDAKIVAMFRASAADDRLGIPIRLDGDAMEYAYPVAILAAERPAV